MGQNEVRQIVVDAILFDMDGTLIDSTPGVLKAWETFSRDYSLGDSLAIAHETHGRRLYDTLKEYCKIDEENKLQEEIDRFENEVILGGPVALPGALALLEQLNSIGAKWTIVTSASNKFAFKALERAGLPQPEVGIITSNDVVRGKPHPDPYQAGASLCKVDAENCLVVEDAVSGIKAGKAAGARVLAVCTSTTKDRLLASEVKPDDIISNLEHIKVVVTTEGHLDIKLPAATH
ncbi:HAD-like protein [Coprinopsis marcescibilis]|uniref:HAD-like protein n=1 Tax=Coprinopsis marcescibilis TaxID=230819 RepID=A0A5C3LD50_COPMA|nr:HAD-like protein [Coprinopsis marcescibilis]